MKIALFTDTYFPQINGVSLTLHRLVQYLSTQGIAIQVFAPDASDEDFFAEHLHSFVSFPFFLYPECRIAIPNPFSIREIIETNKPDLIHVATPFNMGLTGRYVSKKYNIPLVATHHTHFDRYLKYYHLDFVSPWIWRYLEWFHQPCSTVLVPSHETKRELMNHGFKSVDVWPRGVDTFLFTPEKKSEHIREKYQIKERYICLYVGRIAPEKDLDILIEVITRLPDGVREHIHWLIVGDGPMAAQMQERGLPHTTLTGYKQGEELTRMYASADLFVFPSTTETFGNVVLEALASGTPAIGTRSGGVQEIIQHGRTGWLCPPRSADDMIKAISSFLDQPHRIEEMGKHARAYALTQSWDAILQQMVDTYQWSLRRTTEHPHSA
ncbi:glycosyltransferase family 4 protein [Laceyella putida]|uniref:Glycosyltransferase family 4 protein n=1 Tax=Laceyella putida TaxID=110101 RepID=A0ABW2RLI6_9BACL